MCFRHDCDCDCDCSFGCGWKHCCSFGETLLFLCRHSMTLTWSVLVTQFLIASGRLGFSLVFYATYMLVSLLRSMTGILSSVCVSGMLCAGYSSGVAYANCVLLACCGLLLEYCRLCVSQACSVDANCVSALRWPITGILLSVCVSQACFVPATPLVRWLLTVCFQPAAVYYWNHGWRNWKG